MKPTSDQVERAARAIARTMVLNAPGNKTTGDELEAWVDDNWPEWVDEATAALEAV